MKYFFLFPLLTVSLSFAADPPPNAVVFPVLDDVSGGWATVVPSHKLSNQFSPNLRNMFVDSGRLEQISGFTALGSTGTLRSIEGIYPYVKEDGTTKFLVTDSSIVLETADFNSYVFVSSGHNVGVLMRCLQIYNNVWCSNGVDSVFEWNGSAKTILDGTNGTPNVPKGRYMSQYLERVFMYGLPSDASGIRFSDVRSTNGAIINPDNFLAWPAGNNLHAGQGDGQIGTAIWIENGKLKLGKERSIYTLFGTNSSNFLPVLTNPNIGVASHDSVVMMDNQSNFVGNDGIYRNETRNSDLIRTEASNINKGAVRIISNLWETQSDFSKGQFFGTTATASGLLLPRTYQYGTFSGNDNYIQPAGIFAVSDDPPTLNPATTFYGFQQFEFTPNQFDPQVNLIPDKIFWTNTYTGAACDLVFASITFRNQYTGVEMKAIASLNGTNGERIKAYFTTSSAVAPIFNGYELHNSSFAFKIEGCGVDLADMTSNGEIHFINATTAQYLSEVSTLASVTAWGTFDSLNAPNGGNVSFYYRTSTSVVNISTQIWKAIMPGSLINDPVINKFIQYASTIASVSTFSAISSVDRVEILHVEGAGASNRAFGINWKNRYWLSVTTSADTSSLILVRSKITNKNPDAWMPLSGINIRSIAKNGESALYAGASTAPFIYRLDYGNNFNGIAIPSFYETPETWMDSPYREKSLFEYYLVADKNTGSSFSLGLGKNGGSFTDSTISLNGTGLYNKVIQNVQGQAKLFRWRFYHNLLDDPFVIHNFAVTYQPTNVRKGSNE